LQRGEFVQEELTSLLALSCSPTGPTGCLDMKHTEHPCESTHECPNDAVTRVDVGGNSVLVRARPATRFTLHRLSYREPVAEVVRSEQLLS